MLPFEAGPLALDARPIRLRARQLLAQPPILSAQALDQLARFPVARPRHGVFYGGIGTEVQVTR
jgi:hypothetical protein